MSKYTDINNYLKQLMKPKKELGGYPVCPYLKKYWDKVLVVYVNNNLKDNLIKYLNSFKEDKEAIVVVIELDISREKLEEVVTKFNSKYHKKDIEILYIYPHNKNSDVHKTKVGDTSFKLPLIVIQRKSTLLNARMTLKKTNYYNYSVIH